MQPSIADRDQSSAEMSCDQGMNSWYQLKAQTIGTCQMQLPGACSRMWVEKKAGAHRPARSRKRSRPTGRAAKPGLTGSTTRSAQRRGAEVVDRHPTLDRKAAPGPPPHSDVWFREPMIKSAGAPGLRLAATPGAPATDRRTRLPGRFPARTGARHVNVNAAIVGGARSAWL